MRPRRVLVTGVSRFLGGRLVNELSADPDVETIVGVDTVEPRTDLGRTEFVRSDIRSPSIAKIIAASEVDTVVHLSVVATPLTVGGRTAMKEINVIGTMQLLAACQKSPSVRKLVLKSTTAVYGSSPKDPALFTEDDEPRRLPRSGYAKDSVEVEGYVRGFGRRRPDVALTMLRFTNFVGPRIDTPLTRYFSLPVVPKVFGYDPRLQFCHEDDGVEVLRLATLQDRPGIFNVGGAGVLLSQAIRRAGRVSFPVLEPLVSVAGQGFRRAGLVDFSPEQLRFLEHGRVADTTRLDEKFGYTPRYTTREAFDDFVRGRGLNRVINPEVATAVEAAILERLPRRNEPIHA
ncbi:MAG TPA: NAD-dependent epimerase/dehydratase family protein [Frankiaceae bacterium]|nr:NAD-dependent epimerase/dehydratase family protein [Frankiaceae bacterium]